jgi:hypothetical protein
MSPSKRVKVGEVSVDSTQILICDPMYLHTERQLSNPKELGRKQDEVLDSKTQSSQLQFNSGLNGLGVLLHSGVGDGTYSVYATFTDSPEVGRRIQKVEIVFLE